MRPPRRTAQTMARTTASGSGAATEIENPLPAPETDFAQRLGVQQIVQPGKTLLLAAPGPVDVAGGNPSHERIIHDSAAGSKDRAAPRAQRTF
jgi:hypothetical protein